MKLFFVDLDNRLKGGLCEIAPQLDIELCADGLPVSAKVGENLSIMKTGEGIAITYTYESEFFRALSMIGRALEGQTVCQKNRFGMLCYQADMSRNAVLNIKSCKRLIRYLALMGFNSMMLYTEDTYEIPEYPYFGRMRGRFSQAELRELDDYAYMFGIELIPCIQTMAHLNTIFRWPGFAEMRDIDDILLVGDERTYQFIDKMVKSCADCFRSRKLNISFDEAHTLGRGKYMAKHGYRKSSDIMLEHLARVADICHNYGFSSPMISSDMFFRMQFDGKYYVSEGEMDPEVIAKVPEGVTLIYWDYYNRSEKVLSHMMRCHKVFDRPIVFFSGAWKWGAIAPHNRKSIAVVEPQVKACFDFGVNDMIVTSWGDDGSESSQFSVFPAILNWAESGYDNLGDVEARCRECFDISYEDLLKLDLPDMLPGIDPTLKVVCPSKYLLYNDPIEGLFDAHVDATTAPDAYREHTKTLLAMVDNKNFGKIYRALGTLCAFLVHKCDFSIRLREAYLKGNRAAIDKMANEEIDEMMSLLEEFVKAYREQWYDENKTYGFLVIEHRLGGLKERLICTKLRLQAYLAGEVDKIEELHEPVLPVGALENQEGSPYVQYNCWARTATSCLVMHRL